MEKAEIQQIEAYPKDLEEGLVEWDYRGPSTLGDVNRLYVIIKSLMDAIYKTDNQEMGTFLAALECKARQCKKCIEARLVVRN